MSAKIIYAAESYAIVGACFEVYNEKGHGFLEPVYHECLGIEFQLQQIPAISQSVLSLAYKGRALTQSFKADFLCYGRILVEIKAVETLVDAHRAQALNYLHASGLQLALLVNFGNQNKLEHERIVLTQRPSPTSPEKVDMRTGLPNNSRRFA